jgi:eukaryotic-like serine/threonine-protein kinase
MIGPTTTGQSESSRRSVPVPRMAAAQSVDGPATVLRSLGSPPRPTGSSHGEIDSELHRRLFPSDAPLGAELVPSNVSGSRLEHFRIEEMIGRGGMGAVFRAYDERLDRVVALKVLSPGFSRDPATVERFRNEAKSAARLDHENVARVFYSGEDRGMNFIAFEFVTGTNLRDLIRENGRLSPEEAVNYTLQVAAALRHTSAAGVVHRDIKPSNIIITPSGRAKLVDLGLARKESSESSPELTVAGTTLGTFDYISPEQAKDPRDVDVRSDIYSLGCTLYHMLTGEPPYPEGTFLQKLLDRQDKSVPDPAAKAPGVSSGLSTLVQKMMATTPRMRHATADELISDLMHIAGELGLRGVHPEGLVWAHVSRLYRSRFLERNLGWIVTAVILGVVVFAVDRFSRVGTERQSPLSAGSGAEPGTERGKGDRPAASGGQGKTASEDVNRPNRITFSQHLAPEFLQKLPAGIGLLGSIGIESSSESPDSNIAVARKTPSSDNDPGNTAKSGASNGGTSTKITTGNSVEKPAAITIFGRSETFPSLEGACRSAENGQVIVLNFDGVRVVERPLHIANKTITIRAAEGKHPVLLFAGEEVAGTSAQTKMVTVSNGSLNVVGVGFRMRVNDQVDANNDDRWSVFALQGRDSLRLKGVHVTVENAKGRAASIFEIVHKNEPDLSRMKMMKKADSMAVDQFEITVIEDSFLRGDCDVLTVASSRRGSFNVDKSAIVAAESLLSVIADGSGEAVTEGNGVDLKLVHVTCVTGNAAIRIAAGEMPGSVLPVRVVQSQDNLFAATRRRPFVSVSGAGEVGDLKRLFSWNKGQNNFYSGFATMWRIAPNSAARPDTRSFEEWKTDWGTTREIKASNTGVDWKRDWSLKSADTVLPADLELDASSETSMDSAAKGATDGKAVGADVSAIAKRMGIKTKPVAKP